MIGAMSRWQVLSGNIERRERSYFDPADARSLMKQALKECNFLKEYHTKTMLQRVIGDVG